MTWTSREIRLAARPVGEPQPSDFELAEVEVPDPADEGTELNQALLAEVPQLEVVAVCEDTPALMDAIASHVAKAKAA